MKQLTEYIHCTEGSFYWTIQTSFAPRNHFTVTSIQRVSMRTHQATIQHHLSLPLHIPGWVPIFVGHSWLCLSSKPLANLLQGPLLNPGTSKYNDVVCTSGSSTPHDQAGALFCLHVCSLPFVVRAVPRTTESCCPVLVLTSSPVTKVLCHLLSAQYHGPRSLVVQFLFWRLHLLLSCHFKKPLS